MTLRAYEQGMGLLLGKGLDVVKNSPRGDCIVRTEPTQDGGRIVDYEWSMIRSREQLAKYLNISVAASLRNDTAGIEGSAKFKYFSKQNLNRYSVFMMFKCTVKLPEAVMRDVMLKTNDRELLSASPAQFRNKCGDEFIVGFIRGAEFYSIFEFATETEDDFNSIIAKLNASSDGIGTDWSISGDYTSVIKQLKSKVSHYHKAHQEGGPKTTKLPGDDPQEIQDYARQFPTTITQQNSIPYSAITTDYGTVENVPTGSDPIREEHAETVIKQLGDEYSDYLDRLANVNYALRHPEQFIPEEYDSTKLTALKGRLEQSLNTLVEIASDCYRTPGQCAFPGPGRLPDIVVVLPPRLSRTTRGAIELAKTHYERARGHAEECIEHAGAILDISRVIRVGPDGKKMADHAKLLFGSAGTAKTNTTRAKQDAQAVPVLSEEVNAWVQKAKDVEERAIAAHAEAREQSTLAYDIGYAPYWNAPTTFYPYFFSEFLESYKVHLRQHKHPSPRSDEVSFSLQGFAVDPAGGSLKFELLKGRTTNSRTETLYSIPQDADDPRFCYYPEAGGSSETCSTGIRIDHHLGSQVLWIVMDFRSHATTREQVGSTEWDAPFAIVSERTGLKTRINAKVYLQKNDNDIRHPNRIEMYINRPVKFKVFGDGPYERNLVDCDGATTVNPNQSLGWNNSIEKVRKQDSK